MCGATQALTGVTILGAGMGAMGSYQQGRAEDQAARAEAEAMERNAERLALFAGDVRHMGQLDAQRVVEQGQQFLGSGRTGFAAANVQLGEGTTNIWEMDTQRGIAIDASTALSQAELEARGVEAQADDMRAGAGRVRAAGRDARRAGRWGAATSLLTGAGQVASIYRPVR